MTTPITVQTIVRSFSDVDLTFQMNPLNGDLAVKTDAEDIKASIRNLILTMNYERPFHPEIGSPVYSLLFELSSPLVVNVLETVITQTITKLEPRATINSVTVIDESDSNSYIVTVNFSIINYYAPFEVSILLQRLR